MKKLKYSLIGSLSMALAALGISFGIGAKDVLSPKKASAQDVSFAKAKLDGELKQKLDQQQGVFVFGDTLEREIEGGRVELRADMERILGQRKNGWESLINDVKAYVKGVSSEKKKKFLFFTGRAVGEKDEAKFLQLLDDLKVRGSEYLLVLSNIVGGQLPRRGLFADHYVGCYYGQEIKKLRERLGQEKFGKKEEKSLKDQIKRLESFDKGFLVAWLEEKSAWLKPMVNKGKEEPLGRIASAIRRLVDMLLTASESLYCVTYDVKNKKFSSAHHKDCFSRDKVSEQNRKLGFPECGGKVVDMEKAEQQNKMRQADEERARLLRIADNPNYAWSRNVAPYRIETSGANPFEAAVTQLLFTPEADQQQTSLKQLEDAVGTAKNSEKVDALRRFAIKGFKKAFDVIEPSTYFDRLELDGLITDISARKNVRLHGRERIDEMLQILQERKEKLVG